MSFFSNIFSRGDGFDDGLDAGGTTPDSGQVDGVDGSGRSGRSNGQPGSGGVTTAQTDQGQQGGGDGNIGVQAPQPPAYLADWDGGVSFEDAVKSSDRSIIDVIGDYNKWAKNGGHDPLDIMKMAGVMQGNDITKSAAENEREAKKAERMDKWQRIGNVLQHFGNFVGTIAGAPSQQIEKMSDLTARQQKIRDASLAQRAAYNQNFLAQIWKDRADQRAAEKNTADIGLIGQKIQSMQEDDERKKAKNDADIELAVARKQQAEQQAQLTGEKIETEKQTRQPKIEKINADTAASRARAASSNSTAYGNKYNVNRYKIWAENKRKHPNDFKQFMSDNGIHSWDRKNWSRELIDQYNAWIADKYSDKGNGGGGGAASLLD